MSAAVCGLQGLRAVTAAAALFIRLCQIVNANSMARNDNFVFLFRTKYMMPYINANDITPKPVAMLPRDKI